MDSNPKKSAVAFKITGNWATKSKELKTKFPQLTDADLKLEPGKDEELLTRLTTKLSKRREDVISIVNKAEAVKA